MAGNETMSVETTIERPETMERTAHTPFAPVIGCATPYYQDSHCTIYHADSRAMLDAIECDCVLTDPPYGIEKSSGT